jgi:hypothetical protein
MTGKIWLVILILVGALGFLPTNAHAGSAEQQERIEASFVIALGRAPSASEVEVWQKQDASSVAGLLSRHRQTLTADAALQAAVAAKAFQDANGREPVSGDLEMPSGSGASYTELMVGHIQRLAENPSDYEQVIQRAYRFVIRRDAYSEEIDYWNERATLSYILLVGCMEDWARRNQPGLMVTSGTPTISINCDYLATVRLSPKVAAEAREAAGLPPAGDGGTHVIAAGAGAIVSGGRIHFAMAGADGSVQR